MTTQQSERPDANQLLLTGGKAPEGADFGQIPPSTVAGTLISGPVTYHARDYDAKNPGQGPLRYWPDNNPVYGVHLDLDIPGLGLRRLYVEKLRMITAIQQAMLRAGVKKMEPGGWLSVMWTGTEAGAGNLPANTYMAEYRPPNAPVPGTPPSGNAILNGAPAPAWGTAPAVQSAPAQWQQGVPGTVNGGMPTPAPTPVQQSYAPAAPTVAPPAPFAPQMAPAQPSQPVLTETIAAAMRNAGIPTDGYAIIPG